MSPIFSSSKQENLGSKAVMQRMQTKSQIYVGK